MRYILWLKEYLIRYAVIVLRGLKSVSHIIFSLFTFSLDARFICKWDPKVVEGNMIIG